ncbi:uncharacterized protein LOC114542791, partial [Dendronephthya gigantea]|uniref:uncharacterized protein LOC114542791 n=1 Tax=Dendronephthya gigantea TaxID=151771 RepID=UPI001068F4C7
MATLRNLTGYGPRKGLIFDGDESKYELWEVKFLGYMRLRKLYQIFVPPADDEELDATKNADAFAELVQCLDDRSLSLIIREAKDNGRRALGVLREHYQGKGKPRIIALYTELTSLKMAENETSTDYIIRAETAATSLKAAEEVISEGLLVAMALKGLPASYKTFSTVVIQREKQMTFAEFKIALRNYEESEKTNRRENAKDNVMYVNQKHSGQKFEGKCFKCDKKGHKSADCWTRSEKWCNRCKTKTHNTKDCRKTKDSANTAAETQTFAFTVKDHVNRDKSSGADGSRANVVFGKGDAKVKLYDAS